MIKNRRQFIVSNARMNQLRKAISQLSGTPMDPGLHPQLRDLEVAALRSQLEDIQAEVSDYLELVESPPATIKVESLHELPRSLIRARIASGLTHQALADRLGLKAQAIQRYEATDYASANFLRLTEVADALGVQVRQELHLDHGLSGPAVVRRLREAGVNTRLLERRFLSAGDSTSDLGPDQVSRLVHDVQRVFKFSTADLRSSDPLTPDIRPQLAASFKKPVNANDEAVRAYIVYAHYLAMQVSGLVTQPFVPPPSDWRDTRAELIKVGGVNLRSAVNYAWDLGMAVVPLQDRISIHGAFWNFGDRAAIIVKQGMRTTSRWLVDLLHELYHAATEPDGVVELASVVDEDIEELANEYAAAVALGGRAEELFEAAVNEANGKLPFLKRSVQVIAAKENVPLGVFANVLAWRLMPEHDWWGAAANLQVGEDDPWEIVRDVMLERVDLSQLPEPDQRLVMAALRDDRDLSNV